MKMKCPTVDSVLAAAGTMAEAVSLHETDIKSAGNPAADGGKQEATHAETKVLPIRTTETTQQAAV